MNIDSSVDAVDGGPRGGTVVIRAAASGDAPSIIDFAVNVPSHDLLFLGRDIRNARVVSAWLDAVADGAIDSLVAVDGDRIVATTALVHDPHGWSPHVAEVRILVAADQRGRGLGRRLLDAAIATAGAGGVTKMIARMTPDQRGAISLFEDHGFRGEALLRDHVRDADGALHDLVILSLDVGRVNAISSAYGRDGAG